MLFDFAGTRDPKKSRKKGVSVVAQPKPVAPVDAFGDEFVVFLYCFCFVIFIEFLFVFGF